METVEAYLGEEIGGKTEGCLHLSVDPANHIEAVNMID